MKVENGIVCRNLLRSMRTCLCGDGTAEQTKSRATNRSAGTNGTSNYAIRKNTNVRNVADNTCTFLCADFDDKFCEHGYNKDVLAYVGVCNDWDIHCSIEHSRSGNGVYV